MFKRVLLLGMLLGLIIPVLTVLGQGSSVNKQAILADIQKRLNDGNTQFNGSHYDDAIKSYQAALDLVNQYKGDPAFANSPELKQLQTDEFETFVGLGQSNFYAILSDDERNRLSFNDIFETERHDSQLGQVQTAIDNWQMAASVGKTFAVGGSDLGMVYIYLGRGYREMWWSSRNEFSHDFLVQSQQAFTDAVDPFKRDFNSFWEERALYDSGFDAADLASMDYATDAGLKWEKLSLKLLRQAANMLISSGDNRYGVHIWDLEEQLFRFSQLLENGTFSDSDSNLDDLLNEQLHIANLPFFNDPHIDYRILLYRGLTLSRLAWRSHNTTLAANAIPDLLTTISAFQRIVPNNPYTPESDLNGMSKSVVTYCEFYLGRDYLMIARLDLAVDHFQADQNSNSEQPDGPGWVAWTNTLSDFESDWLLGESLSGTGHYAEAIQAYQKVERKIELPFYPDVLLGLSDSYERQGNYESAIAPLQKRNTYYDDALKSALAQSKPDPVMVKADQVGEIDSLLKVSSPLIVLGRTEEALTNLQQAQDQATKLNDNALLVDTLLRIGDIYLQLDDQDNALAKYTQAAALAQKANLFQQRGRALLGLSRIQMARGLLDKALVNLNQANQAAQSAADTQGQVEALTALGDLALLGQKPDMVSAQGSYQQALTIASKAGDSRLSVNVLTALGDLQGKQNIQQAVETYHDALAQAELIDDWEAIASLHGRLGQVLAYSGQVQQAILNFNDALDVVDQTQRGFQSTEVKSQFAANYAWIYDAYIKLLFDQKRYEEAFTVAEHARARTFLDQLAIGPIDLRKGASTDLLEQGITLRQSIDATQALLTTAQKANPPDKDYILKLHNTLDSAENSYTILFSRLQAENPSLATLTGVQIASAGKIQSALDNNTTLLSYYTTHNQTYVFIIGAHSFSAETLHTSRSQLSDAIAKFRADEKQTAALDDLYKWLILPIADQLHTSRLTIVPHNVLNYLPFTALTPDSSSVLGDKFAINYLPSATSLLYLPSQPQQSGGLLAFGNSKAEGLPPLPFAESEVKQIASITGGDVFTGADAKESVLLQRASNAGILYLAVHGTFNPRNPLFSALHLTPGANDNGVLTAYQIYSLDLTHSTKLVVLSACETAVGSLSAGDEFSGLNRAFLYAGAPAVIASLWSVDDKATSLLMVEFFKERAAGKDDAEALQGAQAAVRRYKDTNGNTPYAAPYFWAAFILTGRGTLSPTPFPTLRATPEQSTVQNTAAPAGPSLSTTVPSGVTSTEAQATTTATAPDFQNMTFGSGLNTSTPIPTPMGGPSGSTQ